MEYIPVELLDEFRDGRGTVSREKRRAESTAETKDEADDGFEEGQLALAEMDFMNRAYKAKLRQLAEEAAEEENDRRDREELAQRWDTLRRTIEDNLNPTDGQNEEEGQQRDEDDTDGTEEAQEEGEGQGGEAEGAFVLASPLGTDDFVPEVVGSLALVVDGGQRPGGQRRDGAGGEVILLDL